MHHSALIDHKVRISGSQFGHCNICGNFDKLTEDHIPPKGTLKVPQVVLYKITELLAVDRPIGKKRGRQMQSGVFYKSLCGACNSGLLGTHYDPELIRFANSVTDILKTSFYMPERVSITAKPGLLARSILGHLLAVGLERTERTPLLDSIRTFVQDKTLPLPNGVVIHYWLYPYRTQVAIRDAGMALDFFKTTIVFWCLKFFPVGFLVTLDNEHPERIALPKLGDYMLHSGTHEAEILLPLTNIPPQLWPEAPGEHGAILYGDGAHAAFPGGAA